MYFFLEEFLILHNYFIKYNNYLIFQLNFKTKIIKLLILKLIPK